MISNTAVDDFLRAGPDSIAVDYLNWVPYCHVVLHARLGIDANRYSAILDPIAVLHTLLGHRSLDLPV